MTRKNKRVFYEEILSWYLPVLYEKTLSRYLRVAYEEHLSRYLRGNIATSLRGIFTWSLRRNDVLRLYDEIFFSLSYDELARRYALRRTSNDETCFLANPLLRRTHEEYRRC